MTERTSERRGRVRAHSSAARSARRSVRWLVLGELAAVAVGGTIAVVANGGL